mgnify:CR=1 FL=1
MNLRLTTPPALEPVTLTEAKAWLRVDGEEEDVLILGLIQAARSYVEDFTRRALVSQTWALALDRFPCTREITLPRPPLVSVSSVEYIDSDGATQTLSADDYHVDARSEPGRVVLRATSSWPAVDCQPNAVVVTYVAGYGTPSQVPQGIKTAIRWMIGHWFRHRAHVNIGNIVNQIPDTTDSLLWQFRVPVIA